MAAVWILLMSNCRVCKETHIHPHRKPNGARALQRFAIFAQQTCIRGVNISQPFDV